MAVAPVLRDEPPADLEHRSPEHHVGRDQSDEPLRVLISGSAPSLLAPRPSPRTARDRLRATAGARGAPFAYDRRRHPSELPVHVIVSPTTASASRASCIS